MKLKKDNTGLLCVTFVWCDKASQGAIEKLDQQMIYLISSLEGETRVSCERSILMVVQAPWIVQYHN